MASENVKLGITVGGGLVGMLISARYYKQKSWIEFLVFGWAGVALGFVGTNFLD